MNDLQSFVTGLIAGALEGAVQSGYIVEVEKVGQDYQPTVKVVNMRSGTGVKIDVTPYPS